MNLPFIDRIWRTRGALPLEPAQSAADAFGKLDPLFQANGTTYQVEGDTLQFRKANPNPQDKLATFTSGTLQVVDKGPKGRQLKYDLASPALRYCFLAPLLFLAFAAFLQVAPQPAGDDDAKQEASQKKDAGEQKVHPLNPIDKFLGAPEPEKPKKDGADKDKGDKKSKQPSKTPAYVFAALFAILYVVGRILEPFLIRRAIRRLLAGESLPEGEVQPG